MPRSQQSRLAHQPSLLERCIGSHPSAWASRCAFMAGTLRTHAAGAVGGVHGQSLGFGKGACLYSRKPPRSACRLMRAPGGMRTSASRSSLGRSSSPSSCARSKASARACRTRPIQHRGCGRQAVSAGSGSTSGAQRAHQGERGLIPLPYTPIILRDLLCAEGRHTSASSGSTSGAQRAYQGRRKAAAPRWSQNASSASPAPGCCRSSAPWRPWITAFSRACAQAHAH